jgi:hypothetical protein
MRFTIQHLPQHQMRGFGRRSYMRTLGEDLELNIFIKQVEFPNPTEDI